MSKTNSLGWFIERYGKEEGTTRYNDRCQKIAKGRKKSHYTFFLTNPKVLKILGNNVSLNEDQRKWLDEFFSYYPKDRDGTWRKNIAIWIKYGLDNWVYRREQLSKVEANSKQWYQLMFGDYWEELYQKDYSIKTAHFKNRLEYWLDKGYTKDAALEQVSKIQKNRVMQSPIKKGCKEYSIRAVEYWIKKGVDEKEAKIIVSNLQKRDLLFYTNRYGEEEGKKKFNDSKEKRKNTWKSKDLIEHSKVAVGKGFNPNSEEMKAVLGFIFTNNIPIQYCKFGPPSHQYWENIPNVGIRRYDLAVFEDLAHTKLRYIFEYHGIGHINFSDYHPVLANERMEIDGRVLKNYSTYGNIYHNDRIKREHILAKYPEVKYIVMWYYDLKNKRFKIDELR